MLTLFLTVLGLFLAFYWIAHWMRSQAFWDWLFNLEEPRDARLPRPLVPYAPPTPLVPPMVKKDFGRHRNPLLESRKFCQTAFEQLDERTWQCPSCQLVHFEKPSEPISSQVPE